MLVVDVYNVLHTIRNASPGGDGLIELLLGIAGSRYASEEVVLVCDGTPAARGPADVAALARLLGTGARRVVYSGPEAEADDVIERLLEESPDARRVIVVSGDRRLVWAARRLGAASLSSRQFMQHLEKDYAKAVARRTSGSAAPHAAETARWMEYFGLAGGAAPKKSGGPRPAPPIRSAEEIDPADLDMERWLKEGEK